ncbi:MAG: FkbM family methyltransferase [Nitrosomonadaceae bacterium]
MAANKKLIDIIRFLTSEGYSIDQVFDVGANKGRWTAKYSQEIPGAHFVLFEANPNHKRPTNLAKHHLWFNAVLSSPDTKEVDFYSNASSSCPGTGDSYYKESTYHYNNCTPLSLPTTTLDALVETHTLNPPHLMKLDTQGSELDILNGAKNTLEHVDIIVTETPILPYNKGAPTFNDYVMLLNDHGFVPVGVDDTIFANGLLTHLDLVFLKKDIKLKYYKDNDLFTKEFNI